MFTMLGYDYDGQWTYGHCESCMKNLQYKVKMFKEKLIHVNPAEKTKEVWVCPVCGSTKKL